MKYFVAAILVITATVSYADGPTTLRGTNGAGELFTVDEEYFDYGPQGVPWGPNLFHTVVVTKDGKTIRSYEKQRCGGNELGYSPGWNFSCAKKGESPLAGAIYLYVKELPNCEGYLFVCKEGCGAGAPRELIKEPWECEPLECPARTAVTGTIGDNDVNVREKPSLNSRVLRKVVYGTKVQILERNKTCLYINLNLGTWARVRIIDDEPIKEGWIYDGNIEDQP